ncbi:Protein kinase, putative [Hondaea fermentalgiana]|uniref:Protein kinase, putative n=1 Tax=Hondaea fermentalgiana TaxID=2315210 RepID=A0A2R5GKL1_9STRA|nr:Protein kinase, putative [Hondaea fermentalgiana]|eukprot:GBG28821.1 Protein kinase, putative [Hondaea fermentalgiana]
MAATEGAAWARLRHCMVNEAYEEVEVLQDEILDTHGDYVMGRDPSRSKLHLKEPIVSGQHCRIRMQRSRQGHGNAIFEIQDVSTNGTSVNRERLEKGRWRRLARGDKIVLSMHAKNSTAKTLHQFEFFPLSRKEAGDLAVSQSASANSATNSGTGAGDADSALQARHIEQLREMRKEFEASEVSMRQEHEKEIAELHRALEAEKARARESADAEQSVRARLEETRSQMEETQSALANERTAKERLELQLRGELQQVRAELETLVRKETNRANVLEENKALLEKELAREKLAKGAAEEGLAQAKRDLDAEKSRARQAHEGKLKARLQESLARAEFLEGKLARTDRAIQAAREHGHNTLRSAVEQMTKTLRAFGASNEANLEEIKGILGGPVVRASRQSLAPAEVAPRHVAATQANEEEDDDEMDEAPGTSASFGKAESGSDGPQDVETQVAGATQIPPASQTQVAPLQSAPSFALSDLTQESRAAENDHDGDDGTNENEGQALDSRPAEQEGQTKTQNGNNGEKQEENEDDDVDEDEDNENMSGNEQASPGNVKPRNAKKHDPDEENVNSNKGATAHSGNARLDQTPRQESRLLETSTPKVSLKTPKRKNISFLSPMSEERFSSQEDAESAKKKQRPLLMTTTCESDDDYDESNFSQS